MRTTRTSRHENNLARQIAYIPLRLERPPRQSAGELVQRRARAGVHFPGIAQAMGEQTPQGAEILPERRRWRLFGMFCCCCCWGFCAGGCGHGVY